MAEHERAVFPPEMHTVSFAEGEGFAGFARLGLPHPRAVPVGLEPILPYVPKRVPVDVSLVILAPDGSACRNAAVNKY